MAQEAGACSPIAKNNQHRCERQHLSDFHTHIETDDIGHQSILGEIELLKFGGQAEAVEQAKNEDGQLADSGQQAGHLGHHLRLGGGGGLGSSLESRVQGSPRSLGGSLIREATLAGQILEGQAPAHLPAAR